MGSIVNCMEHRERRMKCKAHRLRDDGAGTLAMMLSWQGLDQVPDVKLRV